MSPLLHPQRFRSNSNKSLSHIVRLNSVTSLRNSASARKRSIASNFGIEFGFASGEPPSEKDSEGTKSTATFSEQNEHLKKLNNTDQHWISMPSTSIQKSIN